MKPRERERQIARRKHVLGRGIDWAQVAHRIHGLVGAGVSGNALDDTMRVRIEERVLHQRLRKESLDSVIRLLTSIVRIYGLDPTWVVTGNFDPTTHRIALEGTQQETRSIVERLVVESVAPAR